MNKSRSPVLLCSIVIEDLMLLSMLQFFSENNKLVFDFFSLTRILNNSIILIRIQAGWPSARGEGEGETGTGHVSLMTSPVIVILVCQWYSSAARNTKFWDGEVLCTHLIYFQDVFITVFLLVWMVGLGIYNLYVHDFIALFYWSFNGFLLPPPFSTIKTKLI